MILLLFSMMLTLSFPTYGLIKERTVPITYNTIQETTTLKQSPSERFASILTRATTVQSARLMAVFEKITSRHEHISQDIEELQARGIDVVDFMKLSSLTQKYIDVAEQHIGLPILTASAQKQFKNMNKQVSMTVHSLKKATTYLNTLQKSLINFYG